MSAARGVFCPGLGAGGRPGKRAKKAPQRRPVAVALGHDNFNFMMRFLWRAA
ncbi:anthranilate phosphoribosyltransferase [Ralstonia solanacearum]|nr:anthranilate phosphoribosyltransferase [Ralstonia solanacearum]